MKILHESTHATVILDGKRYGLWHDAEPKYVRDFFSKNSHLEPDVAVLTWHMVHEYGITNLKTAREVANGVFEFLTAGDSQSAFDLIRSHARFSMSHSDALLTKGLSTLHKVPDSSPVIRIS